jgi:hypothetical protein
MSTAVTQPRTLDEDQLGKAIADRRAFLDELQRGIEMRMARV